MITVKTLHSLPNAFHFETVMKTLERVGATTVPQQNAGVRPLFEDLMTKFQREDTAYKQSLKNFKSDQIKTLDEERDSYAECHPPRGGGLGETARRNVVGPRKAHRAGV